MVILKGASNECFVNYGDSYSARPPRSSAKLRHAQRVSPTLRTHFVRRCSIGRAPHAAGVRCEMAQGQIATSNATEIAISVFQKPSWEELT
jgi:hypothetical protein